MHIFIPPGRPMDGSAYLAEILHAFGLCFVKRQPIRDALQAADPKRDILLLPAGSETAGVESFLHAGGSVVAIQPDAPLERLAGLARKREDTGPWRLRFSQPLCYGAQGESLWTLGPIHVYAPKPGPHMIAYLSHPSDAASDTVGIIECEVGAGRLLVYAYDPAQCIALLRQGYPERANILPQDQRTPRAAFLQHPNPPSDTFWRPTADLHAFGLCEILRRDLSRHAPVPTLWHLPDGRPSILLFSGDEDNSEQSANDHEMRDLESVGGAMNLYVIPDLTSITRPRIEEYTRRGHSISIHPNLVPTAGQSSAVQLAAAEKQVRLFQEKFQWPVRTVRNHFYMWPGYLDIPDLWERFGIGMDANACATLHFQSLDYGPFANIHAAVPLPFVRENGALIDVYQQPTHVNDDLAANPTTFYSQKYSAEQFDRVVQRIFDDAARFFHAPICANVHPCNYVSFSGPHGRILMSRARALGLPIWSLDRWHDFWRARASWKMSGYTWDGTRLRFALKGSPCESLWLTLPPISNGRALQAVSLDGTTAHLESVQRHGYPTIQVPLPRVVSEVAVVAQYGEPAHPSAP
ncbi:MAG: hypothetical protein HY360_04750 [Verrucomicrobia bacterium]|nr:hypothetical protein [Verrucomicrobiota bacterium]